MTAQANRDVVKLAQERPHRACRRETTLFVRSASGPDAGAGPAASSRHL